MSKSFVSRVVPAEERPLVCRSYQSTSIHWIRRLQQCNEFKWLTNTIQSLSISRMESLSGPRNSHCAPQVNRLLIAIASHQSLNRNMQHSGGVHFAELSPEQAYSFQKDLLKTMLTIENTYINVCLFHECMYMRQDSNYSINAIETARTTPFKEKEF